MDWSIIKKNLAKLEKDIYTKYSKPLQESLEHLLRRFITFKGDNTKRINYNRSISDFDNYIFLSTLYRFFYVLAILRLSGRELTYYKVSCEENMVKLRKAISNFKSSLADGQNSELTRVKDLLCNIEPASSLNDEERITLGKT